jgi:hypothetical protein
MAQPLDYARRVPIEPEVLAFRRVRSIYAIGVVIIWMVLVAFESNWPHTSNSIDPTKAEIVMAEHVIGGTAAVWLLLGMRRILRSPMLRRDWMTWIAAAANLVAAFFTLLWTGYQ